MENVELRKENDFGSAFEMAVADCIAVATEKSRGQKFTRRQAAQLSELRVHMWLIVITRGERDLDERRGAFLQQSRGAAKSNDAGIKFCARPI